MGSLVARPLVGRARRGCGSRAAANPAGAGRTPARRGGRASCRRGRVALLVVRSGRQCSRSGCSRPAVATLTYVYSDSTAVLGPLAQLAEPHSYDLCSEHAGRLTAPRGWEVVRLMPEFIPTGPSPDDLVALAEAVREAGRPRTTAAPEPTDRGDGVRRGHLRVLPGERV